MRTGLIGFRTGEAIGMVGAFGVEGIPGDA
jgi:hypothetical protein